MSKFGKVNTEKQFLSVLKKHYRALKKRDMQINYLGIVENAWTRDLDYWFQKYFSVGVSAYDWVQGNSLLQKIQTEW